MPLAPKSQRTRFGAQAVEVSITCEDPRLGRRAKQHETGSINIKTRREKNYNHDSTEALEPPNGRPPNVSNADDVYMAAHEDSQNLSMRWANG